MPCADSSTLSSGRCGTAVGAGQAHHLLLQLVVGSGALTARASCMFLVAMRSSYEVLHQDSHTRQGPLLGADHVQLDECLLNLAYKLFR
jgi:hypothetical protein